MTAAHTGTPGGPRRALRELDVHFATDAGDVHAVDGVSLEVAPGEILAIVGESGSGKSVTARSVLGLLPETAAASGAVLVSGTDLVGLSAARLRALRGEDVSMIFQEPSSALNPVFPIWWQLGEGLRAHRRRSPARRSAPRRCGRSTRWASPTPPNGSTATRTSSPAGRSSAS